MRQITKDDIIGARITDVHSTCESEPGGLDCTLIYFTVDRGFSFGMPSPHYDWETLEIPPDAHRWPEAQVKRIRMRSIVGVYCHKMDEKLGFHEPDDSLLLFDDGSQLTCITVAPNGTGGSGLYHRTHRTQLSKLADLVDFFTLPLYREGSQLDGEA